MEYNKLEIEKNIAMLEKCTTECLEKLTYESQKEKIQLLENRLKETFQIADFVLHSLSEISDDYINTIKTKVQDYRQKYIEYLESKKVVLV